MNIVRRSVHRVNNPEILFVLGVPECLIVGITTRGNPFFSEDRMIRKVRQNQLADHLLRAFVHLGYDILCRRLGAQLLDGTEFALNPLSALAAQLIATAV